MEPEEFHRIRALSSNHWWYQSLADITTSVLDSLPKTNRILDVGCGTGFLLEVLENRSTYGVDSSPIARQIWQSDGTHIAASGSTDALPYLDETFDLAICLDVIYHREVSSDEDALNEIFRILRPGGTLLLQIPAFEFLRNRHDDTVHTARRYTRSQTMQILTQTGFTVSTLSYRNLPAFPFVAGSKFLSARGSNLGALPKGLNLLMRTLSRVEWSMIRSNMGVPFGSSVIALAHKPSQPIG